MEKVDTVSPYSIQPRDLAFYTRRIRLQLYYLIFKRHSLSLDQNLYLELSLQ